MKFLVDMPLSPMLTAWLIQQGHDAIHASQVGLDRASDITILERAQHEQRVIVTADLDCPRLLALAKAEEPGLILFRGGDYSEREVLERLMKALQTVSREELPRSIVVIEKGRIRRRRLPERTFKRVGGNTWHQRDFRLVCATKEKYRRGRLDY